MAPDSPSSGFASSFLAHFGRVTTSGRFIAEIDGLRFIAILAVFLHHLSGYVEVKAASAFVHEPAETLLGHLLSFGFVGVQFFFVISGFVLALPFASHRLLGTSRVPLRSYFVRRLTRLEPPYIISMLLIFALLIAVGNSAVDLIPRLLASLGYVHNVVYGEASVINSVAWSLEVEIQFYLLVPLLSTVFLLRRPLVRRGTLVAGMVLMIAYQLLFIPPDTDTRQSLSILNHLQFFLVGFLLADLFLVEWKSEPERTWQWDIVSLVGWPLIMVAVQDAMMFRAVLPVLLFLVYCAAFRGTVSSRIFSNMWLTTIGGMCYSIYLLHYHVISFVGRHTRTFRISDQYEVELLWQLALITPFVLIVCGVSFLLVEKPCMRKDWPQRLVRACEKRLLARRPERPAPGV